jgi:hypothetical protein
MSGDRLVGVNLAVRSAVVAVVEPGPLRLVAVAEVALPVELSRPDPPRRAAPVALRALTRTRRRLDLPRWLPVALTAEAASAAPVYAVLLAQAGLPVGWRPALELADHLWSTMDIRLTGALAALADDRAVTLAAGAALAALAALPTGAAAAPVFMKAIDGSESIDERDEGDGWVVQRLGDTTAATAQPEPERRTR